MKALAMKWIFIKLMYIYLYFSGHYKLEENFKHVCGKADMPEESPFGRAPSHAVTGFLRPESAHTEGLSTLTSASSGVVNVLISCLINTSLSSSSMYSLFA